MSAQPATETPLKPAYAGPTFHASPAASALPVPRFFSKSVPANIEQPGLQARLDEDSCQSEGPASSSASTPKLAPPDLAQDRKPTPIDFLLNADRQEKARVGGEGAASQTPDHDPFLQNARSDPSKYDRMSRSFKEVPSQRATSPANRGMFPLELDGTEAIDPQSTPKQTPNRSRASISRSGTDPTKAFATDNEAAAQSLRDLLGVPNSLRSPPVELPRTYYNRDQTSPHLHRNNSSNLPRPLSGSPLAPVTPPDGTVRPPPNLHYGNRNLSPLFQAARAPPHNRPSSGLRQEVAQGAPSTLAELPATNGPASPPLQSAIPQKSPSPSSNHADIQSFSRTYLDAQIQAAKMPAASHLTPSRSLSASRTYPSSSPAASIGHEPSPFNSPSPTSSSSGHHSRLGPRLADGDSLTSSRAAYGKGVVSNTVQPQLASNESRARAPTARGEDMRAMEDNLRRILNLHAPGKPDGQSNLHYTGAGGY
ncbi:MAG: hypothetical protein M1821_008873 [Bathelium mastoideum]|nr:MAG: hypothetical protein M1821_008873 [Bathelium mastoideum]